VIACCSIGLIACVTTGGGSEAGGKDSAARIPVRESGTLDWPALGSDLPELGGGERDSVVIVAIEQYAELAPVAGALVSADDWYAFFTLALRVPKSRVTRVAVKVTEKKMRDAVTQAATDAAATRGRLWFVFIGHGAPFVEKTATGVETPDGLLVDFRAIAGELTGLRHSELMRLMEPAARGGQRPVAILDACYSGKVAVDRRTPIRSLTGGAMTEFVFAAPTPDEVLVLSAGASDQVAYPLPGLPERRPAFSYLLLGGLRGWADTEGDRDGYVTAAEAIEFTQMALTEFGREQRPQLTGAGTAQLSRVGPVPPVDMHSYAQQLAMGGSRPGCNDGFEWRDRKCRPVMTTDCEPGFLFVAGRGCVARVIRGCEAGFSFEPGRGCVLVVAPAPSIRSKPMNDWIADDLVYLPDGKFPMGFEAVTPPGKKLESVADSLKRAQDLERGVSTYMDEAPVHSVILSAFYIDRHEVTVDEYKHCVRAGKCAALRSANWRDPQRGIHPITNVTWHDADMYCKWAGKRLPTEAEWEYAARGTQARTYPWGENPPNKTRAITSVDGRSNGTEPVCRTWGNTPEDVCDLYGNAWEWVSDWGGPYKEGFELNPTGPPTGNYRTLRGAGYTSSAGKGAYLRLLGGSDIGLQNDDVGFRCAADPPVRSVRPSLTATVSDCVPGTIDGHGEIFVHDVAIMQCGRFKPLPVLFSNATTLEWSIRAGNSPVQCRCTSKWTAEPR
jgi:formylglycine-generating enzyme required for sulfatase activity